MTVAYRVYVFSEKGREPAGLFASLHYVNTSLGLAYSARKDWPWELRHSGPGTWAIFDIAERLRGLVLRVDALHGERPLRTETTEGFPSSPHPAGEPHADAR